MRADVEWERGCGCDLGRALDTVRLIGSVRVCDRARERAFFDGRRREAFGRSGAEGAWVGLGRCRVERVRVRCARSDARGVLVGALSVAGRRGLIFRRDVIGKRAIERLAVGLACALLRARLPWGGGEWDEDARDPWGVRHAGFLLSAREKTVIDSALVVASVGLARAPAKDLELAFEPSSRHPPDRLSREPDAHDEREDEETENEPIERIPPRAAV